MDLDVREMDGACHCGTVRFHVHLPEGLRSARRCTCSLCRMRGAIAVTARLDDLTITAGADALTCYTFNTGAAKHYFCSRCGIYTHHQRRSNQSEYGINVACLAGVSPFDFPEIIVNDGVNHPNDSGVSRVAGVLRFIPADQS
ncbi:GFA family protein [Sphingobium nicotianae]|uniref:GFA family protein n=1 Tax=Sphingobium nicotianae TaxID=2782607 RepID=A0A9X1DAB2_9SPHN|nr:GFA family protein [Sphingobium nicotianae]MBT2186293.1 GFA family protein [Sphingobium nicotianae]